MGMVFFHSIFSSAHLIFMLFSELIGRAHFVACPFIGNVHYRPMQPILIRYLPKYIMVLYLIIKESDAQHKLNILPTLKNIV